MLQTRTVESGTLELLKKLQSLPIIKDFYLVGGTSIALQLGHRFSIDLDLFSVNDFNPYDIISILQKDFDLQIIVEEPKILITEINGIKVDFVKMSYPILYPVIIEEGVRMLNIRDICAMKLKVITQRGNKKDFFDLYYLIEYISIKEMLVIFKQKFNMNEIFHVVKSLTYFDDAEINPEPIIFDEKINWKIVKMKIVNEVNKIIE